MEEIIYSRNNNSTISCYSMDFSGISKQNAHGGRNVLPKMFVGRWWYFLEKCWKTGWSEQDVRDRRMLPRMATGAVPVRIRTATHFSSENSHRETLHRGRMFRSPWAFVAFSLTLKLVCRKYPKNNEFRTKKFLNQEFLYGISSFCTLSENNSFLHGKISCFCIFLAKNGVFNTNRTPGAASPALP